MEYSKTIESRRSVYEIEKKINVAENTLVDLIKHNLKLTPSAYNSQSQRIMLLLGERNDDFWNLVKEELRKIVPENKFSSTETKINNFKSGYGTVLFFDDEAITNSLIAKFPSYKKNFLSWSDQQNGMLQINIWNELSSYGIGASLQHYAEVIESVYKEVFEVPDSWKLIAQMPFGNIVESPMEKDKIDIDQRIIIHK